MERRERRSLISVERQGWSGDHSRACFETAGVLLDEGTFGKKRIINVLGVPGRRLQMGSRDAPAFTVSPSGRLSPIEFRSPPDTPYTVFFNP